METQSLIVIPLSEFTTILANTLKEIINDSLPEKKEVQSLPNEIEYITRKETAKILGISLVTLSKYTKQGKLKDYRLGHNLRYKRHEIGLALEDVGLLKPKRI